MRSGGGSGCTSTLPQGGATTCPRPRTQTHARTCKEVRAAGRPAQQRNGVQPQPQHRARPQRRVPHHQPTAPGARARQQPPVGGPGQRGDAAAGRGSGARAAEGRGAHARPERQGCVWLGACSHHTTGGGGSQAAGTGAPRCRTRAGRRALPARIPQHQACAPPRTCSPLSISETSPTPRRRRRRCQQRPRWRRPAARPPRPQPPAPAACRAPTAARRPSRPRRAWSS